MTGETGPYSYLQFWDDRRPVTFVPPKGWECSGDRQKLRLIPKDASDVDIDIQVRPWGQEEPQEPAAGAAFEEMARKALPPGAEQVTILSSDEAMQIDGYHTWEITLTHTFYGGLFKTSYLYLVRSKDLVRFRVSGKPSEFAQLRETFHASLHTLAGL